MVPLTIGYTLGDQAGIGPEVMQKALATSHLRLPNVRYTLIGNTIPVTPGCPSKESAQAAFDHLELAAQALNAGTIDALVTGPVSKEGLHQVGFTWPGQTEFFADRLHVSNFAMCLSGKHLTVALATTHTSIKSVSGLLNTREIVRIGKLLAVFCQQKGIQHPRIALAALNPHAGEHGAFGTEDLDIIAPAVQQLNRQCQFAQFTGPEVPDTVYRDAVSGKFDGILAPYHDQGLIPLKLLDFNSAINITLGLPRPRISPDHGTAFGIAGKNIADPSSTIQAFLLAIKIASHQRRNSH